MGRAPPVAPAEACLTTLPTPTKFGVHQDDPSAPPAAAIGWVLAPTPIAPTVPEVEIVASADGSDAAWVGNPRLKVAESTSGLPAGLSATGDALPEAGAMRITPTAAPRTRAQTGPLGSATSAPAAVPGRDAVRSTVPSDRMRLATTVDARFTPTQRPSPLHAMPAGVEKSDSPALDNRIAPSGSRRPMRRCGSALRCDRLGRTDERRAGAGRPGVTDVSPTQTLPSGAGASPHVFDVAGIFEVKSVTVPMAPKAGR